MEITSAGPATTAAPSPRLTAGTSKQSSAWCWGWAGAGLSKGETSR